MPSLDYRYVRTNTVSTISAGFVSDLGNPMEAPGTIATAMMKMKPAQLVMHKKNWDRP